MARTVVRCFASWKPWPTRASSLRIRGTVGLFCQPSAPKLLSATATISGARWKPSGILLGSFRVDPAALERLHALHLSLLSRAETASGPHLFDLDTEFHETIASFTNNGFFIQAIQQQNRLRRLMEYRGYENRRRVRIWVKEHLAIIEALKVSKYGRASQLMHEHLEKAFNATMIRSKSERDKN
jgi:hypothetical protein